MRASKPHGLGMMNLFMVRRGKRSGGCVFEPTARRGRIPDRRAFKVLLPLLEYISFLISVAFSHPKIMIYTCFSRIQHWYKSRIPTDVFPVFFRTI